MLRCLRYLQIFQGKNPRKIWPIDFNRSESTDIVILVPNWCCSYRVYPHDLTYNFYHLHLKEDGRLCFHRCVSVQLLGRGSTYLGGVVPTLEWGEGIPTLDGEGVPTLDGEGGTYLKCEGGTYLAWREGVLTLNRGMGYLPWMGARVPTLDRLCRGWYKSCGFPQEGFFVEHVTKFLMSHSRFSSKWLLISWIWLSLVFNLVMHTLQYCPCNQSSFPKN